MTDYRKSKLPFKIVSSSVNTGYITEISSAFKPGVDITGIHQDTYAGLENEPLQSPFTREHAGGNQHRHTSVNTGDDNDFNRAEAFKIKPESQTLKIYGPDFEDVNKPRAQMWRGAKSPVNISNVQSNPNIAGNFEQNYQVVQTSGRGLSNNLIVDGFEASGVLTTQFITGTDPYSLPDLTKNSKSIFVERFSAPGSKEESSRGSLERYGEELSPNNSLTTRNIKVRQPFYSQLTQHSAQFGSGSEEGISIHKINRNSIKTLFLSGTEGNEISSGSKYDNFWIQHNIPATQFGYGWINSSTISDPYTIGTGSLEFDVTSSISNIKDKIISLDTQTIIGSLSSSDSYYSTWKQIRTAEHPVSRKLRQSNIVAVQDEPRIVFNGLEQAKEIRSTTSTNFKEPPVSSRNHPINQQIKFSGSLPNSSTILRYTFKNNSKWFANEDLNSRLRLIDKKVEFYERIVDAKNNTNNSPINEIISLYFKDTLYPREVNTYLSGTRNRIDYILDQPGFDRDGYDRQLGTQRVFWRDNQEDRRRSPNSEGGHINSLGYSSLEESGSDFIQNDNGILFDNSFINFSSTLKQNFTNLNKSINNSIIPLETDSLERQLFTYTGSFKGTFYNNSNIANKVYGDIVKRSYTQDIAGEFNNSFIDFYEQYLKNNKKQSIGAIYKNTNFKSLLNALPTNREDLLDKMTRTDDEEVFSNPKPKYVSFIGGGELNTGSVFDNSTNFSNDYFNTYISGAIAFAVGYQLIYGTLPYQNKIYFYGTFQSIGGVAADNIAVYDKITQKFSPVGTSSVNGTIWTAIISGSDLYVGGNFTTPAKAIARYNLKTDTWNSLGGGLGSGINKEVFSLVFSGSDLYAGGKFTTSGSNIAKWDGSTWSPLGGGLSNVVRALLLSGSDIYAGGEWLTDTGSAVAKWDGINWSAVGAGLTPSVYELVLSGSDIYAGGTGATNGVKKWDGINWTTITGSPTGNNFAILFSGSDMYVGGSFSSPGKNVAKWNGISWSALGSGLGGPVTSLMLQENSNNIHASGYLPFSGQTTGSMIATWNGSQWQLFNTSPSYDNFSKNILNSTVNSSDVKFSTLDNGLIKDISSFPNKSFEDSIDDYYKNDIYQAAKDYSIIPEFKISDHMRYYVSSSGNNFSQKNNSLLLLDGAGSSYKSAITETSSFNRDFFENYVYSDEMVKNNLESDYSELVTDSITINVKGIKKLLPYNGFYPQDRTIQIANLYNEYVDNVLGGGIYNLNNVNDYYNNRILTGNYVGSVVQYKNINSSIDAEKYQDKYFLLQNTTFRTYLYSSSISTFKDFSQNTIYSYDNHSGSKILSASNGLNIYSFSASAGFSAFYNHLSTNGTNWSGPTEVIQPISASDGFGEYWDYIYENNSQLGEKILFCISSPYVAVGANNNAGAVSFVSATMQQNFDGTKNWEYSNKVRIGTGSAQDNKFGTGISILSCSSGYQVFMAETYGDTTSVNYGNIWVTTSSNGQTWSNPISILSGSVFSSSLGFNNIKAVNFEKNGINRSYLFFTEPRSYTGQENVVGKLFVISSSMNNDWGIININSEKTELYSSLVSTTLSGTLFDVSGSRNSIQIYSNENLITYCFVNAIESAEQSSEIIIGTTYDGINWQKNDELLKIENNFRGYELVALSTYYKDGYEYPVFFTNLSNSVGVNSIYAIHNNQYTQFTLNVSGTEKYVKQAALEPIMAPGILYNTIKSGIAVDWPCATGSQTSIEPYGSGTIVNAYYPQSFKMASHVGQNINELNMYGNLRSNIDYRVPFEKLIRPDDIFAVKPELTSSLIETTNLTSLPESSDLVQFISGCYVYGGYEPYTSPSDFSDFNQLGPKRFSIPFVYRKENATDTGLYSMAMSNFLAETVKFFLKDQLLTSFQSRPDSEWGVFSASVSYYMDIEMSKSPSLVMMEAYHSSKHPIQRTKNYVHKMNGRYFGYPVNKTNKKLWSADSDSLFTEEEAKFMHNDPAYAPYTPPYFEGTAIARVSFTPTASANYKLDDILSNLVIEDIFDGVRSAAHTGSDAYINKMPIESSVKIDGKLPWADSTTGDQNTFSTNNDINTWIISTRFETPVLDFTDQSLTAYENNYMKSSGYGRGMWSGYGKIPASNKGVIINLKESFPNQARNRMFRIQSLLQKVGFNQSPTSKKVGVLEENKIIKEAIMVIPFIERVSTGSPIRSEPKTLVNAGVVSKLSDIEKELDIEFILLRRDMFERFKEASEKQEQIASSILDTINKMKQFIVPPQLDYVNNQTIDPYVAYILEFQHKLSQQDLADIWQGVSPRVARIAEHIQSTISHPNSENEFFHGFGMPDDVRFMIFKIKQKGEFDYFKITKDSTDDQRFRFEQTIGRGQNKYSYNWPYDFYSLIELAKMDVEIKYKKKDD